jgi:hypothetical protein
VQLVLEPAGTAAAGLAGGASAPRDALAGSQPADPSGAGGGSSGAGGLPWRAAAAAAAASAGAGGPTAVAAVAAPAAAVALALQYLRTGDRAAAAAFALPASSAALVDLQPCAFAAQWVSWTCCPVRALLSGCRGPAALCVCSLLSGCRVWRAVHGRVRLALSARVGFALIACACMGFAQARAGAPLSTRANGCMRARCPCSPENSRVCLQQQCSSDFSFAQCHRSWCGVLVYAAPLAA